MRIKTAYQLGVETAIKQALALPYVQQPRSYSQNLATRALTRLSPKKNLDRQGMSQFLRTMLREA